MLHIYDHDSERVISSSGDTQEEFFAAFRWLSSIGMEVSWWGW